MESQILPFPPVSVSLHRTIGPQPSDMKKHSFWPWWRRKLSPHPLLHGSGEYGYKTRFPPLQSQWLSGSNDVIAETGPFTPQDSIVLNWMHPPFGSRTLMSAVRSPYIISNENRPFLLEMYVPEPTNIPIEKTNHRGETDLEVPLWPTPSENDIIHLPRGKCPRWPRFL